MKFSKARAGHITVLPLVVMWLVGLISCTPPQSQEVQKAESETTFADAMESASVIGCGNGREFCAELMVRLSATDLPRDRVRLFYEDGWSGEVSFRDVPSTTSLSVITGESGPVSLWEVATPLIDNYKPKVWRPADAGFAGLILWKEDRLVVLAFGGLPGLDELNLQNSPEIEKRSMEFIRALWNYVIKGRNEGKAIIAPPRAQA